MKVITVAAACINQTPLDWEGNFLRLKQTIVAAKAKKIELLCLPELTVTGYGCEDMFLAPNVCEKAEELLEKIKNIAPEMILILGIPWRYNNAVFNTAAVVFNNEILGLYAKQNLAGDGVHYEPRWFSPWQKGKTASTTICGKSTPIGDIFFKIDGVTFGLEICEDAWVANRPGATWAAYGAELILNPSASHFAFNKQKIRERFILEGSRAYGVTYVYANALGNEAGRMIFDGGAMIAQSGELLASEKRFSFQDFSLISAAVDVEIAQTTQAASASRLVNLSNQQVAIESTQHHWQFKKNRQIIMPSKPIERKLWCKEEEFSRAVALALFDYMRKSYSKGFVLSLSGGADSSAVACLIKLSLDFALAELGKEGVQKKLAYLQLPEDQQLWMKSLLSCVYQASAQSGTATEHSAKALANSIGASYQRWDVAPLIENYTAMLEQGIQRKLSWQEDDITLQNIQARVRAPGVWMLTNITGGLLLSTSNRSEAAVGYATMDGDTCGGVSPIAGIDKAFLRHWLKWLEHSAMEGIEKIAALSAVNALQPTAELRPQEYAQTDESDLMPYPVLDAIEKAAIRDKRKPLDCYQLLLNQFPEYDKKTMKNWIHRFFSLWSRNQWKRERYAPSFHLDDENLDPKTWCRFPILSGGFKEELKELEAFNAE